MRERETEGERGLFLLSFLNKKTREKNAFALLIQSNKNTLNELFLSVVNMYYMCASEIFKTVNTPHVFICGSKF